MNTRKPVDGQRPTLYAESVKGKANLCCLIPNSLAT